MSKSVDRDRFIKFYPSDWRGDDELRACSLAARGLWWELCCLAFKYGGVVLIAGEVPTDADLAKQVGCTKGEFTRLASELLRRGVASQRPDGAIFSRRLVRDARRREINKANGDKGGNPNLTESVGDSVNRLVNQTGNPHGSPESRNQNPEPETKENTPRARRAASVPSEGFEGFWNDYPLKIGKVAAIRAWNALAPDINLRVLIATALGWQASALVFEKDGQTKGTHPATWLNGRRWEDERPAVVRPRGLPAPQPDYESDSFDECQRLHGGECGGKYKHALRMSAEIANFMDSGKKATA